MQFWTWRCKFFWYITNKKCADNNSAVTQWSFASEVPMPTQKIRSAWTVLYLCWLLNTQDQSDSAIIQSEDRTNSKFNYTLMYNFFRLWRYSWRCRVYECLRKLSGLAVSKIVCSENICPLGCIIHILRKRQYREDQGQV